MTKYFISIAILCLAIFFSNGLMAQGPYYTSFPDIDGDGFKEPLTVGATYDINDFTFTFPGNVNIRSTGDSIAFLAVFLATGCQSNCADLALPFYHSSGQMYGVMGADRSYHGSVSFPMPGDYFLVAITKNGFGVRETFRVTNCGGGLADPIISVVPASNNTAPLYYTSFPDIDGDGFKEPLTAGATYDINDFTFTFPGNVNIRNTGDSIAFLAVFLATGCESNCADLALPFYHSSGQMYGVMGADRSYHGSVSFSMPGDYFLVAITKNGFGVRETFQVTNCTQNTVYVTVTDTVYLTDTNSVATLQLDICDELATQLQTTSLTDLSNVTFDLTIAPNPTATTVKVLLDNDGQSVFEKLQIVGMNGQVLLESTNTEINVSELPATMYIARIIFQKSLVVNQPFIKVN